MATSRVLVRTKVSSHSASGRATWTEPAHAFVTVTKEFNLDQMHEVAESIDGFVWQKDYPWLLQRAKDKNERKRRMKQQAKEGRLPKRDMSGWERWQGSRR